MSALNERQNRAASDHQYFDVTISNLAGVNSQPQVVQYNDTRTIPFLNNPEDFNLVVARFTANTSSLPVFVPQIQPNQPNRDLTVYSVTLEFGGYNAQAFVDWNPQNANAILPPAPNQTFNGLQDNSNGYYNCYSYSWFIERIYGAFVTAFADLCANTAVNPATAPTYANGTFAPVPTWDATTNSCVLYADSAWYDVRNPFGNGVISVFMNNSLYELFSTFPGTLFGTTGIVAGKNVRLPLTDIGGINSSTIIPVGQPIPAAGSTYKYYRALVWNQEMSTVSAWSPILSFVFTTNTIPIEATQTTTPVVYSNGRLVPSSNANANTTNILTDLATADMVFRPNLNYTPLGEYRRISLKGNRPLYNIDLSLYYKLRDGTLVPFTLLSGESVTVKLYFEKKQ
jgi:hypothetical protein